LQILIDPTMMRSRRPFCARGQASHSTHFERAHPTTQAWHKSHEKMEKSREKYGATLRAR